MIKGCCVNPSIKLFQSNGLSEPLLRSFDSFWLSFADKVTAGWYNFVSLIVKIILLELAFVLSLPATDKTQYFVHLSFNSILELVNGILSDLSKLLRYFNGKAIVAYFRNPLASFGEGWEAVFPNHLALYSKDLK